jgi:protein-disulfide isomerase
MMVKKTMKDFWMSLTPRARKIIMATVAAAALGLASLGYTEGWLGGWFKSSKPAVATVQPQEAAPSPTDLGPLPTTAAEALQIQPTDRVLGRFGAPVTVIEYASLTCGHCADFKSKTFPQFQKEWIDTGKVVFVLRELPWDNLALGMSAVARCVAPDQYYPMIDALFAAQKQIVTAANPLEQVKAVAGGGGLSGAQVEECIANPNLQAEVLRNKNIALNVLQVKGTPAFFINGTEVEGAIEYSKLKTALGAAYATATQTKP